MKLGNNWVEAMVANRSPGETKENHYSLQLGQLVDSLAGIQTRYFWNMCGALPPRQKAVVFLTS
jgi:hypothetical protein